MTIRLGKDHYAGGLLVLLGAAIAYQGSRYEVGSLTRMGPGYLPTVLGFLLIPLGLAIGITASPPQKSIHTAGRRVLPWGAVRGPACILASIVVFVVFQDYLGLAPAAFASVFVAARGDERSSWLGSLLLAFGVAVFAVLLFVVVLGTPLDVLKGF